MRLRVGRRELGSGAGRLGVLAQWFPQLCAAGSTTRRFEDATKAAEHVVDHAAPAAPDVQPA